MLKFLRKYNTLILVVGGSLLMVVFLVPQAIQQLGQNPSNIPYARIDGQVISYEDLSEARDDWQRVNQILGEAVMVLQIQDVDHWMMLVHEAEKYGLIGGPTDGALGVNFFAEYVGLSFAIQEAQRNPWFYQDPDQFQSLVERQTSQALAAFQTRLQTASTGTPEIFYYRAIAKLRGIERLLDSYNSLAGDSIPEIQLAGADMYDRVTANIGIIPASAFRPNPSTLDATAVQAHFEAYRDINPGEGEFGFGYLQPDGVKYEMLRINADAIRQTLQAEPADELEYFRRNQGNYGTRTFEEARDRVRADYLNSLVKQRMDKIAADLGREITRAEQALPADRSAARYRVVPEDYVGPTLESYAAIARDSAGLEGEAAEALVTIIPADESFRGAAEIEETDLRGAEFVVTTNERIRLARVLLGAKEFSADERLDIQQGLLFGPLVISSVGGVNDLLFVRILETRQEGPAESLAEVEERVREDLATLRGYEELSQRADMFREAFADGGINWFNTMQFAGSPDSSQYLNAVIGLETVQLASGTELFELSTSAFPEGVISKARQLNPMQPIEDQPMDARTVGVLMPSNLSLGLASIESFRPVTNDRIREGATVLRQRVVREAQSLSTVAPFSFDSLAARLGFERLDVNQDDAG